MVFLYVLIGILGAAALVFTVQNPDPVAVNFLNWRTVGLLLLAVALGLVVASISAFATQIQLKLKIRRLEQQLALSGWPARSPLRVEPRRVEVDRVLPGA